MRSTNKIPLAGLGLVGILACGDDQVAVGNGSGDASDTGSEPGTSATTTTESEPATTSSTTSGSGNTGSSTDSTGASGSTETEEEDCDDPDPAILGMECDTWDDHCGPCYKCMPRPDPSHAYHEAGCSPLDPNPKPFGEPCTLVELPEDVFADDCGPRAMCAALDDAWACRGFCQAEPAPWSCEEPDTACAVTGAITASVCRPVCYPLEPDCADGLGCYKWSLSDFFTCWPGTPPLGDVGEDCGGVPDGDCMPHLFCAPSTRIPACDQSCCTELCDLSGAETCWGGLSCQVLFEDGGAVPGYENLGWCVSP